MIVSVVLSLPTTGPMLLAALKTQDMYLAGSFLMFLALLTVIGMLISDLALAALDPRIRLGGGQHSDDADAPASSRAPSTTSTPRRSTRSGTEALTAEQERFYLASQWQLMWWKFRRHIGRGRRRDLPR